MPLPFEQCSSVTPVIVQGSVTEPSDAVNAGRAKQTEGRLRSQLALWLICSVFRRKLLSPSARWKIITRDRIAFSNTAIERRGLGPIRELHPEFRRTSLECFTLGFKYVDRTSSELCFYIYCPNADASCLAYFYFMDTFIPISPVICSLIVTIVVHHAVVLSNRIFCLSSHHSFAVLNTNIRFHVATKRIAITLSNYSM